ncbi:hypothetical protein BDN72DRAFT_855710 [Pluteus cervinus]|uniref:Uncharacterized protein n=1 Tax=Pluteus cervinus TaxID=181527 RepID=A0ACD3B1C8_9AGAR|nr:hypothetical protein BDN72DRAFT_855710 [Pluteus cervinus]
MATHPRIRSTPELIVWNGWAEPAPNGDMESRSREMGVWWPVGRILLTPEALDRSGAGASVGQTFRVLQLHLPGKWGSGSLGIGIQSNHIEGNGELASTQWRALSSGSQAAIYIGLNGIPHDDEDLTKSIEVFDSGFLPAKAVEGSARRLKVRHSNAGGMSTAKLENRSS